MIKVYGFILGVIGIYREIYLMNIYMKNLPILLLLLIVIMMILLTPRTERFGDGGMAISDKYCAKLVDTYYKPYNNNSDCQCDYRMKICGRGRRNTIYPQTGNYFTQNHTLV